MMETLIIQALVSHGIKMHRHWSILMNQVYFHKIRLKIKTLCTTPIFKEEQFQFVLPVEFYVMLHF